MVQDKANEVEKNLITSMEKTISANNSKQARYD